MQMKIQIIIEARNTTMRHAIQIMKKCDIKKLKMRELEQKFQEEMSDKLLSWQK